MAEYNVQLNKFNSGTNTYDILYPQTKIENVIGYVKPLLPTIEVQVATGTEVSVTNGEVTLNQVSQNNRCIFDIPRLGTWEVTGLIKGKVIKETVLVEQIKPYVIRWAVTAISELTPGSIVLIAENGVDKEYLVVNQGNPNTKIYDTSCNGTWLLRNNLYARKFIDETRTANYCTASIQKYLNQNYLGVLDSRLVRIIKQVKIPYNDWESELVSILDKGCSTKCFLLSAIELGFFRYGINTHVGDNLDLFPYTTSVSKYNIRGLDQKSAEKAAVWYTRTVEYKSSYGYFGAVNEKGQYDINEYREEEEGIRPAFILPSSTLILDDGHILF